MWTKVAKLIKTPILALKEFSVSFGINGPGSL